MKVVQTLLLAGILYFLLGTHQVMGYHPSDTTQNYSEYLDVKVTASDQGIVFINFKKLARETVRIRILDERELVLHTEKVYRKTSVLKRYDISNLPAGTYAFEVSNEVFLMRKKISKP